MTAPVVRKGRVRYPLIGALAFCVAAVAIVVGLYRSGAIGGPSPVGHPTPTPTAKAGPRPKPTPVPGATSVLIVPRPERTVIREPGRTRTVTAKPSPSRSQEPPPKATPKPSPSPSCLVICLPLLDFSVPLSHGTIPPGGSG